jgi:hypothetical protein
MALVFIHITVDFHVPLAASFALVFCCDAKPVGTNGRGLRART